MHKVAFGPISLATYVAMQMAQHGLVRAATKYPKLWKYPPWKNLDDTITRIHEEALKAGMAGKKISETRLALSNIILGAAGTTTINEAHKLGLHARDMGITTPQELHKYLRGIQRKTLMIHKATKFVDRYAKYGLPGAALTLGSGIGMIVAPEGKKKKGMLLGAAGGAAAGGGGYLLAKTWLRNRVKQLKQLQPVSGKIHELVSTIAQRSGEMAKREPNLVNRLARHIFK